MSRVSGQLCPVCRTKLADSISATVGDRSGVDCTRCGRFEISGTAAAMLSADSWTPLRRAIISHKVRLEVDQGATPLVASDLLDRVRDEIYVLPTTLEQAENALREVARHVTETGEPLARTELAFCARIGASSADGAASIVRDLITQGLLRGRDASTFDGLEFRSIEPTMSGWERLRQHGSRPSEPKVKVAGRSAGQHAIFIGYRRTDTADVAGRIYDRIEEHLGAKRVFKDVDSIPIGTTFREFVRDAIGQCAVFLALIGPGWIDAKDDAGLRRLDDPDDLVRVELETAFATGSVRVVPVLVNGADMPAANQLPPSLHRLCDLNAAQVRRDPDFRRDMDRLMLALDVPRVGESAPSAPPVWVRKVQVSKYRRLFDHLIAKDTPDEVRLSFDELEALLQRQLPPSAKRDRSWWANTAHVSRVQARAWLDAGYIVQSVDFPSSQVVFLRDPRYNAGSAPTASPLKITTRRGGDFESFRNHQIYTNRHTFSVAVTNTSPSEFVSNCKLHLEIARTGEPVQSFLLLDTFTLNAGEDRLVPIVSYDEPIPPHPTGGPELRFLVPVLGQGYDVGHGWPWQAPLGAYSFTLKATSRGHPVASVPFSAWVDGNGVLNFVQGDRPSQTAAEYMSWADLVRHVIAVKWGASFNPEDDDQVMQMLENIRDQFSLIMLEAQGRREDGGGQVGAMAFIETKGFWDRALWHYGKSIPLNDARLPSSVWRDREIYRDVRVKRADVLKVWPAA